MLYMRTHEIEVKSIMRTCGLSANACRDLSGHLARLERNNGVEYLVATLKERFSALLSGTDRFSHHSDGTWKGPFRQVSLIARKGRKGLDRALTLLRLHSVFIAKAASLRDYKRASTELRAASDIIEQDSIIYPEAFRQSFVGIHHYIDDVYPSSPKRCPMGMTTMPETSALPIDHIRSMDYFPTHVARHYNYYKSLVGEDLPDVAYFLRREKKRKYAFRFNKKNARKIYASPHDLGGRVTILNKDPSLKQRLVCNANRVLQLACSPVHNYCMEFLRRHPSSFTHRQDEGVEWISQRFQLGWRLSSIDLKSASDNIPLGPQVWLLKKIVPSLAEPLSVFYEVSRMVYLTTHKEVQIKWTCGSPMGVKGSFGLFTLFLMSVFEDVGAEGCYAIVGDDIVIKSDFTSLVLNSLRHFNVPISKQKSLFDHDRFAEFCGKIIDREGTFNVSKKVFPNLITNPTGLLRLYGKRALRFMPLKGLRRKQIRKLVQFQHLSQDGVIDCLRFLHSYEDIPPLGEGGLSCVQISRVVQLSQREIQILTKLKRTPAEDARWQSLRRKKSNEALIMLQDPSHPVITAWNFQVNSPDVVASYNMLQGQLNDPSLSHEQRSQIINHLEERRRKGFINPKAADVTKNESDLFLKKQRESENRPSEARSLTMDDVQVLVKHGIRIYFRLVDKVPSFFKKGYKKLLRRSK